jgi:hypothetical protein
VLVSSSLFVLKYCAEENAPAATLQLMRALADIAFLRSASGEALMRPHARTRLAQIIDLYHETFPEAPLAVLGKGLYGIESKVSVALNLEREEKASRERDAKLAKLAVEEEKVKAALAWKRTERDRVARVDEKKKACALVERREQKTWDTLSRWGDKYATQNKDFSSKNHDWNLAGWKRMGWPDPAQGSAHDGWLPKADRAEVTVVYADIRDLEEAELHAQLVRISDRLLDLFQERKQYTLCLFGSQDQTPTVCSTLCRVSWQWGTPYVITIASSAYTLGEDYAGEQCMHPVCMEALEDGDLSFGTQRGVIFRLFRPGDTDSTIRQNQASGGAGTACWNAGREEFLDHRLKLVPTICKSHESEPYVYA